MWLTPKERYEKNNLQIFNNKAISNNLFFFYQYMYLCIHWLRAKKKNLGLLHHHQITELITDTT
jgi:hypothetical protein